MTCCNVYLVTNTYSLTLWLSNSSALWSVHPPKNNQGITEVYPKSKKLWRELQI